METEITPAPLETPVVEENSAIKAVRDHAKAQESRAKVAEERVKQLEEAQKVAERSKLDETERLRLENEDARKELSPLRDEHTKLTGAVQKAIDAELARLTPEARSAAEKMASRVPLADRLEVISEYAALAMPASTPFGAPPNPASKTAPETATKIDFKNPFGDYFTNHSKVKTGKLVETARNVV